ncbi:MAG TPA: fructose-1,6-bisphosphatase [Candidatus Limnocylindria bacterium]|nr:fructose-1,6-bisphosphatase [Candidatus Limnocylindria bacterium]
MAEIPGALPAEDLRLRHLRQLAREYPTQRAAAARVVSLRTRMSLPKGTEYCFSDLHGEHRGFLRMLKSASGTIRDKIMTLFSSSLSRDEMDELAHLVYEPEAVLRKVAREGRLSDEWHRSAITRLIQVFKAVSAKYTRSMTRRFLPEDYRGALDELSYVDEDEGRREYHYGVIRAILDAGIAGSFITALSGAIQKTCVHRLHIIGDIYDRGEHPDLIMDELLAHPQADVIWGNHDLHWLGAALGNPALVAGVVRTGIAYNTFDLLEDGYGINLRPLSVFADSVYRDDPCALFRPKDAYNVNLYDTVGADLAARMHKAMAVIQFKLEGQLIARRPEYGMEDRDLFSRADFRRGTVTLEGREHPLKDTHFPSVNPFQPLALSPGEEELMRALTASFRHSARLQRHMGFLIRQGSMFLRHDGQLLYHGCVPMTEDGGFAPLRLDGREYRGAALFEYVQGKVRAAWFEPEGSPKQEEARDFLWYLWCGPASPVFGKDRMATFERMLLEDKATHRETMNPYYHHVEEEDACRRILAEFGLDPDRGHIVNGHVPVKLKHGESPVKGGGRLFMIDGGISRAYQHTTGIGGYTLICNSHSFALAQHPAWEDLEGELFDSPVLQVVEKFPRRQTVADTDAGADMARQAEDLEALILAYRSGLVAEPEAQSQEGAVFDPGYPGTRKEHNA